MVEYVKYPQVEKLIKSLPMLEGILKNLQYELRYVYVKGKGFVGDDDILYALAIGNRELSDMPHATPSPGDKVTSIVATHEELIDREYSHTVKSLINEIANIGTVVEKVNAALNCLSQDEQKILKGKYWEDKTWQDIAYEVNSSQTPVKRKRTEAIEKMVKVLRITIESYEYVIEKLE